MRWPLFHQPRRAASSGLVVVAVILGPSLPAFAAPAPAEPFEVALGTAVEVLAVTASSTDGMLMDAVDGDPATNWQNKKDGERDAWLAVRFAASARLKGVRLQLDPVADVVFDIETSSDGDTYQMAFKNQRASASDVTLKFAKPTNALYLRVRFRYTGTKTAPRYRLRELEPIAIP